MCFTGKDGCRPGERQEKEIAIVQRLFFLKHRSKNTSRFCNPKKSAYCSAEETNLWKMNVINYG
jgi:hypothetical protein